MAENDGANATANAPDYFEMLQVSRNADSETIHRVYRILAARFHPDNPETGNVERFLSLKAAYGVLSDPVQRARYESVHVSASAQPLPAFESRDFVFGVAGEVNRRLGVLSLLYSRRRTNPDQPGMSVLELERLMAFPREFLTFTLWYLRSRGYVSMEENSDFALTAAGVDYVEERSAVNHTIRDLITAGPFAGGEEQQQPVVRDRITRVA
jgi:curved DNA-binding protein CbpA